MSTYLLKYFLSVFKYPFESLYVATRSLSYFIDFTISSATFSDFSSFLKKTKIPKLYVITRGTVPPNPSELLNSSNFKTVIDFLKERGLEKGIPRLI